MRLSEWLDTRQGTTAIIGSGGKTTLMHKLGAELAEHSRVILCTSTHIRPSPTVLNMVSPTEVELESALAEHGIVCIGSCTADGKFTAPELSFEILCRHADYVLCEADGSRGLPLKAHLLNEPVIPSVANNVIAVIGLSGLGRPVRVAAHRAERYAMLAGMGIDEAVEPYHAARVLNKEALHDMVFINQADEAERIVQAKQLQAELDTRCVIGSLKEGILYACSD